MSRYKDFDAGRAEAEGEPVRFRCRGIDIELPSELPAIIPVTGLRLLKEYGKEGNIPAAEISALSISIIGEESLNKLMAAGLSTSELGDVLQWLFAVYGGQEMDDGPGNVPQPEAVPAG
jgi:hypothetical protein